MPGPSSSSSIPTRDARLAELEALASSFAYTQVANASGNLHMDESVFDPQSPTLRAEIVAMIHQYLESAKLPVTARTLADEAQLAARMSQKAEQVRAKLRHAILAGNFQEAALLASRQRGLLAQPAATYVLARQAYFEAVEEEDRPRALNILMERIKPLEALCDEAAHEMRDLAYCLTVGAVRQVPTFSWWDGAAGESREKLVTYFDELLATEAHSLHRNSAQDHGDPRSSAAAPPRLPPNRLIELLRQAVARQVASSKMHPKLVPRIDTLLVDYQSLVIPNAEKAVMRGHGANVKVVEFVGEEGHRVASGSSDHSIRLWDVSSSGPAAVYENAHSARIWDLSSSRTGKSLVSASGDGKLKLWAPRPGLSTRQALQATMSGHEGDAYCVKFHPDQKHVASGGFDKTVRLWDVETGRQRRVFRGHDASVTSLIFNPYGNLIVTGSKDASIKFWDVISGLCVRTIKSHLGEVTSVDMNSRGSQLLSASKDNSNRLWDMRSAQPIRRFKGHQNTSKNFVHASFGPAESLVVGGSEDSSAYVWDLDTGHLLQRLEGHRGMVYAAKWNAFQSVLASCSDDGSVRLWHFDPDKPYFVG